jgi:hypothetical protein
MHNVKYPMQNYVWKHAQKITTNDSMTEDLPPMT